MKNIKKISAMILLSTSFMVSPAVQAGQMPGAVQAGQMPGAVQAGEMPGVVLPELEPATERLAPDAAPPAHIKESALKSLQNAKQAEGKYDQSLPVVVVIDQKAHLTHVLQYQHADIVDVLCVQNSTGKTKTPTPNGRCVITMKEMDPSWTPPRSIDPQQHVVPPFSKTHRNPLGPANLRLSLDHGMIALHGTNEPNQIGKFVSHGCVRHRNCDILKINKLVKVGTPVYIVPTIALAPVQLKDFETAAVASHSLVPSPVGSAASSAMTSHEYSAASSQVSSPVASKMMERTVGARHEIATNHESEKLGPSLKLN